ncbi:uncharacterized protein PHALS_09577 [Plasmopara halstedii]|uniref:Uncharacterized protein n=1 Tax=Plasmopara halstedii TaxID=4781 RepID=A0A0N7L4Q4_PLAHL|nr:uncharacterized protein PHALS_09577 [Plasmopara halstedii]CEG39323.1 hypothetical protein PHALS_09577 [Plasmopara halstedii]|eukprot:XP_024575692.1 hypothetical protein PHALS_09577 [Plasmopara halstedii]
MFKLPRLDMRYLEEQQRHVAYRKGGGDESGPMFHPNWRAVKLCAQYCDAKQLFSTTI